MSNFSNEERVSIAKQEYKNLELNKKVYVDNNRISIGYVSEVINNQKTGEQTYIITDGNPKTQKPEDVKNVIFLNQGSTGVDKSLQNPDEVKRDWWDNNKQILGNVMESFKHPQAVLPPTRQMKSTAQTLNRAMDKYPNAMFDAYGHSQASSNIQYALGALDSQEKVDRIHGAFVYQGPNTYSMMSLGQRARVAQLKSRIFNFVDEKDIVPIGYRILVGQVNPFHVGTLIFVDSSEVDIMAQHMWGGYRFTKGELKVTKESLEQFRKLKQSYIEYQMGSQLRTLEQLRKKFAASGSGLSLNEKIYLDSAQALSVVSIASIDFDVSMMDLVKLYQDGIKEQEKLWDETVRKARELGDSLEDWEVYEALEMGGFTHENIVDFPTQIYQHKISQVQQMSEKFKSLEREIRAKISEVVARDQELAQQLKSS
ncbi:hypothetical protein [Lactococcus sp. UBA7220]|uniref:hypothetical protein n=1 Tax=Lactococcus sp. UBA7220 TaxID=1946735 RepID=UPI00257D6D10|nr:hypothetical protein [Lactococcus sp. UBA7220]